MMKSPRKNAVISQIPAIPDTPPLPDIPDTPPLPDLPDTPIPDEPEPSPDEPENK